MPRRLAQKLVCMIGVHGRAPVGRRFAALNKVQCHRSPETPTGPGYRVPSELDRDRTDEEHRFSTFVLENPSGSVFFYYNT